MNDQDYILFEEYLSGTLSETDKIAFEIRLQEDLKYKESFRTYKELSSFLEQKFENEDESKVFQTNLENISKNYFEKEISPRKLLPVKPWQFAAAASVLLLIGVFVFNNISNPVYEDFSNYDTISLTVRGEQDALLKTAENAFNSNDFKKADEAFKSLVLLDNENAELKFYRALSNLELNKFDIAENLLIDVSSGQSVFKNKAIWYQALSKLKQKEYEECLEILRTLPQEAEDYEAAQKLIQDLN